MKCPLLAEETTDLLLDYSAGRLDRAKTAMVGSHAEACAHCATFLAGQAELWGVLDAWEPEPVSIDFNRRLWQRIEVIANEPWYHRLMEAMRFGAWKPVFPLAAAILVVAAGFVLDHQGGAAKSTGATAASGVSVSEADQIERTLDDIQLLHQFDSVPADGAM